MNKYKTLAALVATALLATVGAASAQTVTGGGASLPADLYKGSADSILPTNFSYAVTGSGTGNRWTRRGPSRRGRSSRGLPWRG